MARFPFSYANSWYLMLYSDELERGAVKRLRDFDRELVAFRGDDGAAHVFDAHCPHLGAHLGRGGKVVGSNLQCPFHAWEFGGDGKCVKVPYANRIPAKAELKSWPVVERHGSIFVWYHEEGKPPEFEIPTLPQWGDPGWTRSWQKYDWTVKTCPQDIMENAIDWPHFHTVHGMDMPPQKSHKFDGKMFFWNIGTTKQIATMGGVTDNLYMEAQNWGLGYNFLTYTGMFTTVISTGLTPIDEETTHFRTAIIGKKDGRSEEETIALLKAYMDDQSGAITQDFGIWENKRFRSKPVLCDGDGPVGEFRRWCRQFYSRDWAEAD